jgi:sugar/nucleoside kinase (ribokinase family)
VDLVVIGDRNPDVLVLGGDVTPAFGQQEKLVGSIDLVVGGSAAITAERWGDERLAVAIAQTDLLLPNEAEALRLSGADSLDAAVSALTAVGRRLVVKLGERGVTCADRSTRHHVSVPAVLPLDTTGAGDCFNAGLIAGLFQGLALPAAAALGCATGALSAGGLGGTASAPDLPTAARLAELASVGSGVPPSVPSATPSPLC